MKKIMTAIAIALIVTGTLAWASQSQNAVAKKVYDRITQGILPEKKALPEVELTQEQKIIAAMNTANPAVATIHTGVGTAPSVKELTEKFIARAVILSKDGYIATATDGLKTQRANLGEFSILVPGIGDPYTVESREEYGPITILKIDAEPTQTVKLREDAIKIGAVVALGGDVIMSPAIGEIINAGDSIQTNLTQRFAPGTPLVDDQGALIGMYVVVEAVQDDSNPNGGQKSFLPVTLIKEAFTKVPK